MKIDKLMNEWKKALCDDMDLTPVIEEVGTRKLLDILLDNVGSTESFVRENVASAFWTIAWDKPILSSDDYIHALATSLSDTHLFNGIEKIEDDTAFCRAFSSLFVRQIILADEKQNFLSQVQYMEALDKAIEYMILEKDRRGFVYGGKGIVHTICHGAMMLVPLVEHPRFPKAYTSRVLDAVKCNIVGKGRFADEDWADSKLAWVISALLNKGISEDVIKEWIETLLPTIDSSIGLYSDEHYPYIQMGSDIKHFLMYLYFDLKKKSMSDGLRDWISDYLDKLWKRVYLHSQT